MELAQNDQVEPSGAEELDEIANPPALAVPDDPTVPASELGFPESGEPAESTETVGSIATDDEQDAPVGVPEPTETTGQGMPSIPAVVPELDGASDSRESVEAAETPGSSGANEPPVVIEPDTPSSAVEEPDQVEASDPTEPNVSQEVSGSGDSAGSGEPDELNDPIEPDMFEEVSRSDESIASIELEETDDRVEPSTREEEPESEERDGPNDPDELDVSVTTPGLVGTDESSEPGEPVEVDSVEPGRQDESTDSVGSDQVEDLPELPGSVASIEQGPDVPPESVINVENRIEVLGHVLDVIDGTSYRFAFALVDDVLLGTNLGAKIAEERGSEGELTEIFGCPEGGRLERTVTSNARNFSSGYVAVGCRIDGTEFDGMVKRGESAGDGGTRERSTDMSMKLSNGDVVTMSSERVVSYSTAGIVRSTNLSRFELAGSSSRLLVENASSRVFTNGPISGNEEMGATFSARVTAPWTGGEAFAITTTEPFMIGIPPGINSVRESYASGILAGEAVDGTRLVLDAGNGDTGSFTLTVDADGAVSSFTLSADSSVQIPCNGFLTERAGESLECELDQGGR